MQQGGANEKAVIVTGPTAGGKSKLALALAERFDGVVINADSMQVYRELPILSAQPSAADRARAPHKLYGVLSASEPASAAWWREAAREEIEAALAAGKLPVLCGGTGLYLRALTEGLSQIPQAPPETRAASRRLLAEIGAPALHAKLAEADPEMAARLSPGDGQRLARAWEVLQATGKSLSHWQAQKGAPAPYDFIRLAVLPPREKLHAAIEARFEAMLAAGALDEVGVLADRRLDPALPAMKALGVPDLMAHLRGELSLEAARAQAVQATRRYAKRQITWLRGELKRNKIPTEIIEEQLDESEIEKIFTIIRNFCLTR